MFKLLTAAIFVTATCVAAVSAQSDTCRACNCQFNNVQVLDQLIQDRIATALESGTGKFVLCHYYTLITRTGHEIGRSSDSL